jgi:hypothetical protein
LLLGCSLIIGSSVEGGKGGGGGGGGKQWIAIVIDITKLECWWIKVLLRWWEFPMILRN